MIDHQPEEGDDGQSFEALTAPGEQPGGGPRPRPESTIELTFTERARYKALQAEGWVADLNEPYFVASLQADGYCMVWPVRDDLKAFVRQVENFRIDTGADEMPAQGHSPEGDEDSPNIAVVWKRAQPVNSPRDGRSFGNLYRQIPDVQRTEFSFEEVGERFWSDPEGFLMAAGITSLESLTVALPSGGFQFIRKKEPAKQYYKTAVVFTSDREYPALLASVMHFTHICPLREDRYVPALDEVLRDFKSRVEKVFPRKCDW